jgi:peptidyl-prolyl cis-trans isomerase A (cyclophilin A)
MTRQMPFTVLLRSLGHALAILTCAWALQACGGGGGGGGGAPADPPPATVTGISPDRLAYGQASAFTVSGINLSSAVSFSATGCNNLVLASGGSAAQQVFTCTPNGALSVRVTATSAGSSLFTATFPVPKPQVTMQTSLGAVVVELEPGVVQATVDNFLGYVRSGFYDGTIFHRVVNDFVAQGGGFTGVAAGTLTPKAGVGNPIALETNKGLSNTRGTIAMARTNLPDTATSQFFFNAADNLFLDYASAASPGYAVFGRIVSGQPVVDAMNGVATQTVGGFQNVPVTDIVLVAATQTK